MESPPACRVVVESNEGQTPVAKLIRIMDLAGLDKPQHGLDHVHPGLLQLPQLVDHADLDEAHEAR